MINPEARPHRCLGNMKQIDLSSVISSAPQVNDLFLSLMIQSGVIGERCETEYWHVEQGGIQNSQSLEHLISHSGYLYRACYQQLTITGPRGQQDQVHKSHTGRGHVKRLIDIYKQNRYSTYKNDY